MDKVDLPLSDIIKSKPKTQRGGRGGKGRGGGGGGSNKGRGGARGNGSNRGGPRFRGRQRPVPYDRAAPQASKVETRLAPEGVIMASNLSYDIDEQDLQEMFRKFGTINKAIIHYDRNGRSQGTAELKFARTVDAEKAVSDYDGAEVDGRPMYLKLVGSLVKQRVVNPIQPRAQTPRNNNGQSAPRGGNRGGSRGRGRGSGRGNGRGRGRGRGGKGRETQKPATQEELDAEMAEYHNQTGAAAAAPVAGQPPRV